MTTRPTTDDVWMTLALLLTQRATCQRAQVGAVLTDLDGLTVLGVGYNGNARGMPNACDAPQLEGACGCIHAEMNALLKAPGLVPKVAYVTTAPCLMCAKAMVNANVKRVIHVRPYRTPHGVELLIAAGITVERIAFAYSLQRIHGE